jgi:UDP-glucose 4-epimerase
MTREEMAHAEDLGGYYRIPADNRDLNYNKFFVEGEEELTQAVDYTSHNTERLNVAQIKEKLLSLDYVRRELEGVASHCRPR